MDRAEPHHDAVTALSQIHDDQDQQQAAYQWATEQLLEGHTPEDLLPHLSEQGWDDDTAQQIVELARKDTRYQRGIITREDIVRDLNVDYRRASSGLSLALRGGLLGLFSSLFGFARSFLAAMRSAEKLKRIARKQ